jgi:hypothetical protein
MAGHTVQLLEEEIVRAKPLILCTQRQCAIIAATCGASYLLAGLGSSRGSFHSYRSEISGSTPLALRAGT